MPDTFLYGDDNLLALSGLQHLAYCERQWALIHLEQIWTDSTDTLHGDYFHERVDTKGYSQTDSVRAERSVRLVSHMLGIYGVADIVEYSCDDDCRPLWPIEYKVGRPKTEDWDCVQLAAQVMCLEEMYGGTIGKAALFYGQTRHREWITIDSDLRERVVRLAKRAHELFIDAKTPLAVISERCRRCSLVEDCVPYALNKSVCDSWAQQGEP